MTKDTDLQGFEDKLREKIAKEIESLSITITSTRMFNEKVSVQTALEKIKDVVEYVKSQAAEVVRGQK